MREELYLRQLKVLHRVLKNVRKKYQGNAGSPQIVDDLNRGALEVHTLQQDMEKNLGRNDPDIKKSLDNEAELAASRVHTNTEGYRQLDKGGVTNVYNEFVDGAWPSINEGRWMADKAVAVLDFGDTKTTTNQTLTIEFPTADSSSAIIRIE